MRNLTIVFFLSLSLQSFSQYFAEGPSTLCDEGTFYAMEMVFTTGSNGFGIKIDYVPTNVVQWYYDRDEFEKIAGGGIGSTFITLRKKYSSSSLQERIYFRKGSGANRKNGYSPMFHVNLSNSGVYIYSGSGTRLYPGMWNSFQIQRPVAAQDYSWEVSVSNGSLRQSNGSTAFRILPNEGASMVIVKVRPYVDGCYGNWITQSYSVRQGGSGGEIVGFK